MAKSTGFFTLRSGSTKSLTFQTYRGQQVTKDRVSKVANPQSNSQMVQRIKLASIMQTRSTLKPILNHSFEGVDYGEKSLEEFVRLNLKNDNSGVSFLSYGTPLTPGTAIATFQISKGCLTPLHYNLSGETELVVQTDGEQGNYDKPTSAVPTKLDEAQKYIFDALGLDTETDQLTAVYAVASGRSFSYEYNGTTFSLPVLKWRFARLAPSDAAITASWKWYTPSDTSYPAAISDGTTWFGISDDQLQIIVTPVTERKIYMGALVASRRDGQNWQRSLQYLDASNEGDDAMTEEMAIEMLLKNSAASNKYLNMGVTEIS